MNKFWQNNTIKITWLILLWWLLIAVVIGYAIHRFPFTPTFPYYEQDLAAHFSRFWSTLAHFDGIHYLRIAVAGGYPDAGEVAYFPLYPFLIRGLINIGVGKLWASLLISNFALILSLLIFLHVYPASRWKLTLILLTFPTSFFFAAAYTESLYLLLFALMLFFIKERRYLFAALVVAAGTATRFVGVGMALYLALSMWGKIELKQIIRAFLVSLAGLAGYMFYLSRVNGDPLSFIHVQPQFGMGRSGGEIIWLPQVLFRYAKMLVLVDPTSLLYWRAAAEIILFILVAYALYKLWHQLSPAELIYSLTVLLIPTLSGTLSSYPRYVLVAIPLFAAIARNLSTKQALGLATLQICLMIISLILFTEGVFVA